MIADLWAYELGDVILLSMVRDVRDTILAKLDQFIFTEDVALGDVSEAFAAVAVVGPLAGRAAAAALSGVPGETLDALPDHGNLRTEFRGRPAIVLRASDLGADGYDVLVDAAQHEEFRAALRAAGAVDLDPPAAETLRIEAGVPKFHRDMDEETIPLEAGIESRAISLTKGCYVGQEVIIRVLHRGHGRVARKLVGLTVEGAVVPPAGAVIRADGRDIGHVTSSAHSPALGAPIALAYVHRDFTAAGTAVVVDGTPARVSALPFVAAAAAR
jgi:folate-binding protein YgfZ